MEQESHPKLAAVLKGVVAFVEVRSNNDNRSAAIGHELTQLGAMVETVFSDEVTHVVYKEGLKRTWIRATKRGVPMVSVSWLDSCKQHMRRMPESDFPAILPEELDSPRLRINQTSRWKKMRSMQPCDFEEEVARSAERGEKRRKRVMMANRFKLSEESTPNSSPVPILAMETQPRCLIFGASSQVGSPIPDTPPSMKERLERMRREQKNVLYGESSSKTPKIPNEKPLQKRLFEKLASDFASTGASSDEERENTSDVVKQLIDRLDSDDGRKRDSGSNNSSVENLNEGPLIPENSTKIQNLSDGNITSNSLGMKQNRRRSLRISSCHNSFASKYLGQNDKEHRESEPREKSFVELNSQDTKKLSLALSPKDINICIALEKASKADSEPCKVHCKNDLIGNSVNVPHESVDTSSKLSSFKRDNKNSDPQNVQRRRSYRVFSKVNSNPESKTKDIDQSNLENTIRSSTDMIKSKSIRKKRNLYTEGNLDTSLPEPKNISSEPVSTSDEALFFGKSELGKQDGKKVQNKKIKRSALVVNDKFMGSASKKSKCDLSANEPPSKDILGNSMSIMYENDTVLSDESNPVKSRRSIDEFQYSQKSLKQNKKGKSSEKVKLHQIEELTEQKDQAAATASRKVKGVNRKRGKDSSSSCDNAEADCKKQKCFSSENEDTSSSPQQLINVQPRLRHAQSLVLESPQLLSLQGVQYSMVVTSLHRGEQELVYSVLKKLGVFRLTNTVEWSSTHIVCGEPRRTLNLLKAIARGCWVLSKEWVFKSLEAGAWLKEEDFEMEKELLVVKRSRLARHRASDDYRVDLFSTVGPIFVAGVCKPPRKELVHLIQLCSGKVTGSQNKASLCIGEFGEPGKRIIKPTWILDSIMKLECLPAEDYTAPIPKPVFSHRESSPEF